VERLLWINRITKKVASRLPFQDSLRLAVGVFYSNVISVSMPTLSKCVKIQESFDPEPVSESSVAQP